MKRIEILSTFRSGGQSYHAGEVRLVQPEKAEHFCRQGWAKDLSGEVPLHPAEPAVTTLSVADGVHGTGN